MARMTFKAGDDYALKLSALGSGSEAIAKRAIYEAAGIVTDAIHAKLLTVLSEEASGDLCDSLGITPILQDKQGNWNAKVGFDGYDRRGVPNQMKARILESGSSRVSARPFVEPAVRASRRQAEAAMENVIDEEIQRRMQ